MRRGLPLIAVSAALASGAPAADAAVRLGTGELHSLAASGSAALAVVDAPSRSAPFRLLRSTGGRASDLGGFGEVKAEFPDVAAADGRAAIVWTRPVSGGAELTVLAAPLSSSESFGRPQPVGFVTGPARLALTGDGATVAFPDRDGDAALATLSDGDRSSFDRWDGTVALSANAPERRHLPLDLVEGPDGPLVLDLVQRRTDSELRVLGTGAPSGAVTATPALRHIEGTLAVSGRTIAVAWMSSGRAQLATSRDGGPWRRRRLAGPGGGRGPAAVTVVGGHIVVAYAQRVARSYEIYVATVGNGATVVRRMTSVAGPDLEPRAASADGRAWIGWTRTDRDPRTRRLRASAMLQRVG